MDKLLLIVIIISLCSLSFEISNLAKNEKTTKKKKFPSLKELVGTKIEIKTESEVENIYGYLTKGILKTYNEKWIVLETTNKKNKKELYYYRINDITSINITNK